MHCLAGLDSLTSGAVYIGETYLATLNDKDLTELRRKKVGFIFQAYNLIPTLNARENIMLPLMLGGESGDPAWIDEVVLDRRPEGPPEAPPERAVGRPAAARRRRPRPRRQARHHLRRRADGQPRLAHRRRDPRLHAPRRARVRPDHRHGHPRPGAARYADRVVFLNDGRIADEMAEPTGEQVLDRMKAFGE